MNTKNSTSNWLADVLFLMSKSLHIVTKGISVLTTIGSIFSIFLCPYALIKMLKSTSKMFNISSIVVLSISWLITTIFLINVDKYYNRKNYLPSILFSIPLAIILPGFLLFVFLPTALINPFQNLNKKIGMSCIRISDKYSAEIKKMLDVDNLCDENETES